MVAPHSPATINPTNAGGRRMTISADGGDAPVWSRDASGLFYVDPENMLVAVDVSAVGEPIAVAESSIRLTTNWPEKFLP